METFEKMYKKQLPDLEIDTKVLVRNKKETGWYKRHFAGWTEDGRIKCWSHGATSWTDNDYSVWDEWKLPEEEKDG